MQSSNLIKKIPIDVISHINCQFLLKLNTFLRNSILYTSVRYLAPFNSWYSVKA